MRRRRFASAISGVLVSLACFPVSAQIYRCPGGGGVVLQQSPCAGLGQSGGRLLVLPNGRLAPVPVSHATSAGAGASDVPKVGRVLGRTPLPSSEVAAKPN